MSYRFERSESASAGLRRIVLERLEHAREQLEHELRNDAEDAVHTARKDFKKARSTIRLVRQELGKKGYRRDNELLRDAGRELSDVRDAAVSIETLEKLRERFEDELTLEQSGVIAVALQANAPPSGAPPPAREASRALELIERERREVAAWQLRESGWELLGPGVKRAYRRGRDALAEVESAPSPEAVHDLRKRVKDLWYHLRLLEEAWPEVISKLVDQAHDLADLLGDHHDLTVLVGSLDNGTFDLAADERAALGSLAQRRQAELVAEAFPLGRRLYAEKPKAFERRLATYWEAWRD